MKVKCSNCGEEWPENLIFCGHCGQPLDQAADPDPLTPNKRELEPAATKFEPPSTIPGYTVLSELGRGGTSVLYRARHEVTGNQVALKIVLLGAANDTRTVAPLQREVQVTRNLRHPNIVQTLDSGCVANAFFIATEFCTEGDVAKCMQRRGGTIPMDEALPIILQTLDGIHYLHEHRIIHRGLSTTDILLLQKGHQLTAKIRYPGGMGRRPHFMPRQQVINFKYSKPEVDVWATAACLYNMLTGAFPRDFVRGGDPWQTVLQSAPLPILQRNPRIPRVLADVIDRALIEHPEIPFKSAIELRRALEVALESQSSVPSQSQADQQTLQAPEANVRKQVRTSAAPLSPPPPAVTQSPETAIASETPPTPGATVPEEAVTQMAGANASPPAATSAVPSVPPDPTKDLPAAEADVPGEWEVGQVYLNIYKVEQVLGEGGFGKVYRVHHRNWNLDLAVKCPRTDKFASEAQKANFTHECETWIKLGLHPHIVSCHYVRTLGGIPRVFAEYVAGGTLHDWIKDGRLYDVGSNGSLEEIQKRKLERILDIAIQFAWGLHYAHEHELHLIHQDVKPRNVLMTLDGTAKVADFGLADARATLGSEQEHREPGRSMAVPGAGFMTPEYASPEQAAGKPLSRRTDLWSWAVSVYEMFVGEMTWRSGSAVPELLEEYLKTGAEEPSLPRMPEAFAVLLKQCFQADPDARPKDMGEIVAKLKEIYPQVTGQPYSREEPQAAELLADGLNNKALSLLDMGQPDQAVHLWEQALKLDPGHIHAGFNLWMTRWKNAQITDAEVVKRLESCRANHPERWEGAFALGVAHLTRGDRDAAREFLRQAKALGGGSEVQQAIEESESVSGFHRGFVRSLAGHRDAVLSVAFIADGRLALSTGKDATIRLWDIGTGQPEGVLSIGNSTFYSATPSKDGQWILSGDADRTLRLWNLTTRHCVRVFEGHEEIVLSVALSNDGTWALSGSADRTLRLWETATGRCTRVFRGHIGIVLSVALSPDSRWAVSASQDSTIRLWDVAAGKCISILQGHLGGVLSVAANWEDRLAISGSVDQTLRLWRLSGDAQCLRTLEGHGSPVTTVALSTDGQWACSGSMDGTVRLWEVASGRCARTFEYQIEGHREFICSVSISPDRQWALSGREHGTVTVWGLGQRNTVACDRRLLSLPRSSQQVSATTKRFRELLVRADEAYIRKNDREALELIKEVRDLPGFEHHPKTLALWNKLSMRTRRLGLHAAWPSRSLDHRGAAVFSVAFARQGFRALTAGVDRNLRLWDLATGECVLALKQHQATVYSVALSNDGQLAVSGGLDGAVLLWHLATGKCICRCEGHQATVHSVALSADAKWAVSGSDDRTVRLWDCATGRCLHTFGHRRGVSSVAIAPNGRCVLSGDGDKVGCLWDLSTGRCLQRLVGHSNEVFSVALSSDSRLALTGSADKTVRVWNLADGRCIKVFDGHTGYVHSVSFSADSRMALSGSADNSVRLWELATGRCVYRFQGHSGIVFACAISTDSRWILSGSFDGTARLWESDWELEVVPPADWDDEALPYLDAFLSLHSPYATESTSHRRSSGRDAHGALTPPGHPQWTEEDFTCLLNTLACAGYGWLRAEGVRSKLQQHAQNWKPLPMIWERESTQSVPSAYPDAGQDSKPRPALLPSQAGARGERPLRPSERLWRRVAALRSGAEAPSRLQANLQLCSCGHQNPPSSSFCSQCGASLGRMDEGRCPHCGESSPHSAQFCPHCGWRVTRPVSTKRPGTAEPSPPHSSPSRTALHPGHSVVTSGKTESMWMALGRFLRELCLAKAFLVLDMLIAVAVLAIVTLQLTGKLFAFPELPRLLVGSTIGVGAVLVWLGGFARGVRGRSLRYTPEYPPTQMLSKMHRSLLATSLILTVIIGLLNGVSIWYSWWYGLLGTWGILILTATLYAMFAAKTMVAVRLTGNKQTMVADAYRGIWLFSALSLLAMHAMVQHWGGNAVILCASMISAVFAIGYASGYIR